MRAWGLGPGASGVCVLVGTLLLSDVVAAQSPQGVEPIRCWRQATTGAVTIGEPFRVIVTCAVFESSDAQVVPDESRLDVASIQMAPFEIIGGTHPPDVRRGMRRFFQYGYDVRIISRDAIGKDVSVPPLTISYRVHSRVGAAAKLEGRDLTYVLPALPIRVLSMVPSDADDIRDSGEASLAAVDTLRSRSRIFNTTAIALAVLSAAMLLFALVPVVGRRRAVGAGERESAPERAIVAGAVAALRDAQGRASADTWKDDEIAASLAAVRVVGAVAANRTVSRKPIPAGAATPEGRLRVEVGWLRRQAVSVSSAVTTGDLGGTPRLDRLRSALDVLTRALYLQTPDRDAITLDAAVRDAIEAGNEVAAERAWFRTGWTR